MTSCTGEPSRGAPLVCTPSSGARSGVIRDMSTNVDMFRLQPVTIECSTDDDGSE